MERDAGHLFAIKGAPILDWRGLNIIAHWDQDLRRPMFEERFHWRVLRDALPRSAFEAPTDASAPAEHVVLNCSVRLQFARGECQVWQMETEVKPHQIERVFGSGPFTPAHSSDPNDPRKLRHAAQTLLNATRPPISPQSRDELQFFAERLAYQIKARSHG